MSGVGFLLLVTTSVTTTIEILTKMTVGMAMVRPAAGISADGTINIPTELYELVNVSMISITIFDTKLRD